MNLDQKYRIANKLSETMSELSRRIFDFRNGEISILELKKRIRESFFRLEKEMKDEDRR